MPTKEQLESALRNADKAGDVAAAKALANALKAGQYDQPATAEATQGQPEPEESLLQKADKAILSNPVGRGVAEFASAANRSIFDMIDFFGMDNVNAALQLAGSDKRAPTARGTFGSEGGYMEPGLARDIVQSAGQAAPMAVASGQVLRSAAGALPAVAPGESAGVGVLRQLGSSTAAQDVAGGVGAGVGSAIGQEVGGDTGRMVGTLAGALTGVGALSFPELIKRAFRGGEAGRQQFKAAVDDFAEFGRVPTYGQASGDGTAQGIENISSKLLGGGPIRDSFVKTSEAMQQRLSTIADDLSRVRGDTEAGRVINRGITGPGGFVERFQGRSGQLWNNFDNLIDDTAPVTASNTQQTLNRIVNDTEFGQVLNNPLVARVRDMIDDAGGVMDYRTFRQLRTSIGQRLGDNNLVSDIPRSQLKQLYGALSQDLEGVAAQYGDDAVRALGRANKYTKAGHERIEGFVDRIANKVDLDKVFAAATRGGEGIQSINAIKRSLRPEEWEVVTSNVIRKLGRASSGNQDDLGEVFSVAKFLTDWDKLGRAKSVLLSGSPRLNQYRENLDTIARAAHRIKEGSKSMANPSGTGQMVTNVGTAASAGTAAVTGNMPALSLVLGGVALNNGAARLMTSPKFVQWLARASTTNNLPAHIARLTAVAETPEQAEAIAELLSTITKNPEE